MSAIRLSVSKFIRVISQGDILTIVTAMTLALLIFRGLDTWYFQNGITILAVAALLYRPFLQSSAFWLIASLLTAVTIFYNWHPVDNHKYLLFYWLMALFFSFCAADNQRKRILAGSAKFFIILSMGLAVFWKVYTEDYLDGSFFEFTMATDSRFKTTLSLFGIDAGLIDQNRDLVSSLRRSYLTQDLSSVQLAGSPQLSFLAGVLTWLVLIIEFAIFVAFIPKNSAIHFVGHILLVIFIFTTYAIAPVIGFGWLLAIMGFALCPLEWTKIRVSYIASIFLLELYTVHWGSLFDHIQGVLIG